VRRRRALLLAGCGAGYVTLSVAGCAGRERELPGPSTVEGPARRFLVLELIREAQVDDRPASLVVSGCAWHVSRDGALYGDHWGWCEDFTILPRRSPGYLLLTTRFLGGASGGYGRLVVLPADGLATEAFGQPVRLRRVDGRDEAVALEFGAAQVTLAPGQSAPLGGQRAPVEPPVDTGHFEPGFDEPIDAEVRYAAVHHGWLDSRRIAGRAPSAE
jgi:hypothetical protein